MHLFWSRASIRTTLGPAFLGAAFLGSALPASGCGDDTSPAADATLADTTVDETDTTPDIASDDLGSAEVADASEIDDIADEVAGDVLGDARPADTSPDDTEATDVPESQDAVADAAVALPPCEPPLGSSGDLWARQREFEAVVVTGGSGRYRHQLVAAPSGAIINAVTGDYISGGVTDVVDVVRTEDLGCSGTVDTRIHVVSDMEVRPMSVGMAPSGSFAPLVTQGSGQWHMELVAGGTSGAELIPVQAGQLELKRFRAGNAPGDERIAVVDDLTGQVVTIEVRVSVDVGPTFEPPWLWLPVGATWPITVTGGSGARLGFVGAPMDAAVRVEFADQGPRWVADDAGGGTVNDTDAFLGTVITQTARTVGGVGPTDIDRNGRQQELWTAFGPGDIDGDTFADAIIGAAEMTLSLPISGGVFIWRGSADGVEAAPSRVIAGVQRNEQFGAALAQGDFDGDGRNDLVVGAPRFSTATGIVGRALVYGGIDGGLYSNTPVFGATGERVNDLFGHAVAACDFNGDGYDDLAVASYDGEDVSDTSVATNQGIVYLYAGGPDGLGAAPVQTIFGRVPGGSTGFVANAELKFGRVMAAADFNGDGACDLAVSSWTPNTDNGVVWAYRGVTQGPELVGPLPARVWRGTRGGRLGYALEVGDLDRDGLPELIVSQPRWSKTTTQADNHGALRIMRGGDWLDGVATESLAEADFDASILNPGLAAADTNDEYGFRLAVGDVTGDGHLDLIVGGIADEGACTGCVSGTGAIFVLAGLDGQLPSPTPVGTMTSGVSADRVGSAIAFVGNIDASGQNAVLVAVGRDDTQGPDLGRSYLYKPMLPLDATGSERFGLDMPSLTFGWRVGQSLDIIDDLDGDGLPELIVGAPSGSGAATTGVRSIFSGLATLHRGTTTGFEAQPFQTLAGFRRHSTSDFWATEVAGLRDFDGDGRPDVALVSRLEDAVASYGTGTISTATCNVAQSDVGAVAVFGGKADGTLDDQPMLMHFGIQAGQGLDVMATADFNGDGRTDLVVGSRNWDRPGSGTSDNAGGFEVVLGRTRPHATSTTIVCEPDHRFAGFAASDNMATAMAALGDIDGDGCDEIAVGVPLGDLVGTNSGFVEIFFGAGPGCNTNDVRRLAISGTVTSAGVGSALHAADIDGDGLSELVIGSTTYRVNTLIAGGAWVVTGATLAALAPQAAPRADTVVAVPVRLFGANAIASAEIAGSLQNELFGTAVALIPGHAASPLGSQPFVAVSSQASMVAGQPVAGIVRLYPLRITAAGPSIAPRPHAVVAGEAHGSLPTARMRTLSLPRPGGRVLVVGASESSVLAPFSGAAMLVPLDADVEGWE